MTQRPAPIQFRPGTLAEPLAARAGDAMKVNEVAQRDLDRYYTLLAAALRDVDLKEGEALLICDALNGTHIDPTLARLLHAEIEDALEDGLAEKWMVDGETLVMLLRNMTLLQRMAICDAVERWWRLEEIADNRERLVRVGLVRSKV